MMENIILDSWAIIAWLQGEPQGKKVKDLINWVSGDRDIEDKIRNLVGTSEIEKIKLFVNIINLGEVFYILGRRKGKEEAKDTIDAIKENPIEVIPVSNSLVFKAALLKINHPIARADAFAVATAIAHEGYLLTGDPEFKNLKGIPIIWIGE